MDADAGRSTAGTLTPTSYAVLGLLAIRPFTTYELAKQLDRTLSRFWPRARSKLYEEPKKLVARGLAEAARGAQGRRPRTVYTITPRGRSALRDWLAADSAPPVFESEHLLKVFYAEQGSTAELRGTLASLRAWLREPTERNVEAAAGYLGRAGPFPERLPVLVLTGRLLDDYLEMLDRWAAWAEETTADWPERPAGASPDLASLAATLDQARARAVRLAGPADPPSTPAPPPNASA